MSTVVKCSAPTKKGDPCKNNAEYRPVCGVHRPKDQKKRTTSSISARNNQMLKEINIMLRAVVLLPVTKKDSPTYDDDEDGMYPSLPAMQPLNHPIFASSLAIKITSPSLRSSSCSCSALKSNNMVCCIQVVCFLTVFSAPPF